jgi:hypothetical protein
VVKFVIAENIAVEAIHELPLLKPFSLEKLVKNVI